MKVSGKTTDAHPPPTPALSWRTAAARVASRSSSTGGCWTIATRTVESSLCTNRDYRSRPVGSPDRAEAVPCRRRAECLAETLAVLPAHCDAGLRDRPSRGLPEAVVAVPAAALLLLLGCCLWVRRVPKREVSRRRLAFSPRCSFSPTSVTATVLFDAAGSWMASGSRGRPVSLLALVFTPRAWSPRSSASTTVVLLTPVVFATVARLRLRAKPHVYACTHLANSAFPVATVSNLPISWPSVRAGCHLHVSAPNHGTPLAGSDRSRMAGAASFSSRVISLATARPRTCGRSRFQCLRQPWLRSRWSGSSSPPPQREPGLRGARRCAGSCGAALARRRTSIGDVARSIDVPFLAFVLALGLVVKAISIHGLGSVVTHIVPGGTGLGSLLLIAVVAAVLANVNQ